MNNKTKDQVYFYKLFNFFGDIKSLADKLKISPMSIYQWSKIPSLRAFQIEKLSNGKFKFKDLIKLSFKEEKTSYIKFKKKH